MRQQILRLNSLVTFGTTRLKLMAPIPCQNSKPIFWTTNNGTNDKMISWFASHQLLNITTLAGNLVTASPILDLNSVLLALGTSVNLKLFREN